jgi:SNF2 family DNA or RNA helicase
MLKYLDILDEVIKRDGILIQRGVPLRFDGSLDTAERLQVRSAFADPRTNSPLLITAGSGGAGMNLTSGSKIIQCEPWWNANDEAQSYSRCYRMGQMKNVHVWILRGINSLIDTVIEEARDKKTATNVEIMGPLRRADDEPVPIPKQFRYGVGE